MRKRTGHHQVILSLMIIGMIAFNCACGDDTDIYVPMELKKEPLMEDVEENLSLGIEETKGTENREEAANIDETAEGEEVLENSQTDADTEMTSMSEVVSITISAIGDVTLGNHHLQDYYNSFRQTYDQAENKAYFFENVFSVLSADDMTIANLEGVLTLSEKSEEGRTYNIKGDPEYVEILTLGSVEAVSMANNHRRDYGDEGSRDTVNALEGAGIVYAYDSNVGIYETKEGIRIGFVSVNEASQGAGVETYLEKGIQKLQDEGVNLILACCHWGTENVNYPEEYQRQLGQKCIDWGADLVIGHHPHVLQGIEEYQGKYIVHSLGNFCFGANRNPADKDTMIFQQTFTFVDGELQDTGEISIIPCSVSSVTNRNDFRPTVAEGEEAKRIIGRINEFSKDLGVTFTEQGFPAD